MEAKRKNKFYVIDLGALDEREVGTCLELFLASDEAVHFLIILGAEKRHSEVLSGLPDDAKVCVGVVTRPVTASLLELYGGLLFWDDAHGADVVMINQALNLPAQYLRDAPVPEFSQSYSSVLRAILSGGTSPWEVADRIYWALSGSPWPSGELRQLIALHQIEGEFFGWRSCARSKDWMLSYSFFGLHKIAERYKSYVELNAGTETCDALKLRLDALEICRRSAEGARTKGDVHYVRQLFVWCSAYLNGVARFWLDGGHPSNAYAHAVRSLEEYSKALVLELFDAGITYKGRVEVEGRAVFGAGNLIRIIKANRNKLPHISLLQLDELIDICDERNKLVLGHGANPCTREDAARVITLIGKFIATAEREVSFGYLSLLGRLQPISALAFGGDLKAVALRSFFR